MGKKLLVIDDEKSITTIIGRIASELDFEVTTVNNPVEALSAIARVQPDILMLDMVMPEVDGIDILRHVATSALADRVRIVAMTGFGVGYLRLAKAVAALECRVQVAELAKPFRKADIVAVLNGTKASMASSAQSSSQQDASSRSFADTQYMKPAY